MEKVPGTTSDQFSSFVFETCAKLPAPAAGGQVRTLMWDNLNSHKTAQVANTVARAGHTVVARPPYRAVDAPVEYVIGLIQKKVHANMYAITSEADLVAHVTAAVSNIGNLNAFFVHCGY
jgi:transposase